MLRSFVKTFVVSSDIVDINWFLSNQIIAEQTCWLILPLFIQATVELRLEFESRQSEGRLSHRTLFILRTLRFVVPGGWAVCVCVCVCVFSSLSLDLHLWICHCCFDSLQLVLYCYIQQQNMSRVYWGKLNHPGTYQGMWELFFAFLFLIIECSAVPVKNMLFSTDYLVMWGGFAEATINIRALEANTSFHRIDRNLKIHLQASLKSEGIVVAQDNLHFVKPVFSWDHVTKITCEPSLSLREPQTPPPPTAAQTGIAVYSKCTNLQCIVCLNGTKMATAGFLVLSGRHANC